MTDMFLLLSRFRNGMLTVLGAVATLLVFRAFLLPNTVPAWFDQWRNIQMYHFGFPSLFIAAIVLCVFTGLVRVLYDPLSSNDGNLVGLWLIIGAWLAITCITILFSNNKLPFVAREVDLLLGYVSGLVAARLLRRLDMYITLLITCGAIQSIIAIVYQSKAIHTLVSGTVIRAGGTFNMPSDLYLIPLFILPLAVEKIFSSSKTASSVFYMLCVASMFTVLVLTWERSGIMAASIGLFWLICKYTTSKQQVFSFAIVLLLVLGVFFVRSSGPVNYASSARSIHSRSYLLEAGVLIFTHHIVNGVGVGALSLPVTATIHGRTENVQMLQPYNQFLYWLDEMGIIGGVLVILFPVLIYKTIASSSSKISRSVAAVWISVLIAGLFNTIFGCYEFSCGNMLIGSLLGITMRLKSDGIADQAATIT